MRVDANRLRFPLIAVGLGMFALFGIIGVRLLAIAGWIIAATGVLMHMYVFYKDAKKYMHTKQRS